MRVFFSTEADISVGPIINSIQNAIEKKTGPIEVNNYTKELDNIAIITNCFNSWQLEFGLGKPRKYINYKNRSADIRLPIPYDEFLSADKEERFEMVKQNIYDSIRVVDERLNKKKGCSFDGDRMIADIEEKIKDLKF